MKTQAQAITDLTNTIATYAAVGNPAPHAIVRHLDKVLAMDVEKYAAHAAKQAAMAQAARGPAKRIAREMAVKS